MPRALTSFTLGLAFTCICFGQNVAIGISSGSSSPGNTVALNISLTGTGPAPAAAQWTLDYSTADFSAVTVAAGAAATAANKTLACNTTPGAITCLVWGLNETAMANGIIATASLTVSSSTANTSSLVPLSGAVVSDAGGGSLPATGGSGSVTIQPGISGFSCSPLAVSPATSSTCTVSLSSAAPSGGATIALTANPAAVSMASSMTIAGGTVSKGFTVSAGSVTTATPVTLTASYLGINSTFNLTVDPPAPVNGSVTPSSGTGLTQTFSFAYTDSSGVGDISWLQMHFQTQLVAAGACYLQYTRASNSIVLINDAGTAALGPVTLGSSGTLHNSQCTVNGAGSSASASGNNLVVNLALTFAGSFAGTKNVSMGAINNTNVFSGWQTMGSWTVATPSQPAANVSVSPASGSGVSQVFSFSYTDPASASDIGWAQMHFQTQLVASGACYLQYTRATNSIVLINDAGTAALGPVTLGASGSLNNSQCALNAAGSSVSTSGNNLTVNLALSFQPAFAGSKNVSMGVSNNANVFSGWQQMGSWTVTAGNLPPQNVSVSPASGSGSGGTFNFTYSDPYGYSDLSWVQLDFQTQLNGAGACYVQYTIASNTVQLINDAGTGNIGAGGTLGSSGTLANSQCSISLGLFVGDWLGEQLHAYARPELHFRLLREQEHLHGRDQQRERFLRVAPDGSVVGYHAGRPGSRQRLGKPILGIGIEPDVCLHLFRSVWLRGLELGADALSNATGGEQRLLSAVHAGHKHFAVDQRCGNRNGRLGGDAGVVGESHQ